MLRDNHQEEMTDGARSDAQVRPKREDYDTVSKKKKSRSRRARKAMMDRWHSKGEEKGGEGDVLSQILVGQES
jgi:hypothetical protein